MDPDLSTSPPFWTAVLTVAVSVVAPLVMACMAVRERFEQSRMGRLLGSVGRDSVADATRKRVVRSVVASAEGRPIERWDALTFAGCVSVALPILAVFMLMSIYVLGQVFVVAAPVFLIGWWLELRRRGVREASLYPVAIWALSMAIVLTVLLWQEDYIGAYNYLIFPEWWLGFAWPTWLVIGITIGAMLSATCALFLRERVARFIQPVLWISGITCATAVWSTMHFGGYFMLMVAVFAGYGISRGARQTLNHSEHLRILRSLGESLPLDLVRQRVRLEIALARVELSNMHIATAAALGLIAGSARVIADLDGAQAIWLLLAVAAAAAISPTLASANRLRIGIGDANPFATSALAAYVAIFCHLAAATLGNGWTWFAEWEYDAWTNVIATLSVGIFAIPLVATVAWFGRPAIARWGALILSFSFIPVLIMAFASGDARSTEWTTFTIAALCLLTAMVLAFGQRRAERVDTLAENRTTQAAAPTYPAPHHVAPADPSPATNP